MKILALEHETSGTTADQFLPHLSAEAARLYELYEAGIVRETYFRTDRHEAVLIMECADLEEAEDALNALPLVIQGLITFELIPLGPYTGFARLFAER